MVNQLRPTIPVQSSRGPASGAPETGRLPWSRKLAALFIALIADAPPVCLLSETYPVVVDLAIAALLWLVLGRSKLLAMALLMECIPAVGLAPTWTAYVLFEIFAGKGGEKAPQPTSVPAEHQE